MTKQKKRLYLAGKISGLPEQDVLNKFANAEDIYSEFGFDVHNPFEHIRQCGCNNMSWEKIMRLCLINLLGCDAVILLHDWNDSPGAILEQELARKVGIPIFHWYESFDELIKLSKS